MLKQKNIDLDLASFIARRITFKSKRTFSTLSVRIAIMGIMLGLAVMIVSVAIVKGFKGQIREKVRGFAGDITITKFDLNSSYENTPFTISKSSLEAIRSNSNVLFAEPFATKPGIINVNNEVEGVVLKGVDKTYHWDYFKNSLVSGHVIDFSDSLNAQKEILISKYTADRLKLNVGDDFLMYFVQEPLRRRKFKITGIYNSGIEDIDKTFVVGDIALIRRLNNWKSTEVGGYELRLKNFNTLADQTSKISDDLDIELRAFSVEENYPAIFQWLSLLDINTQVILALMLAVAVINMISALLIIILERTNMIGILKALGSSNWQIQRIFLNNAAYLVGLGLLLGNILGLAFCYFQNKTHFFTLDQQSYYINFVPVELSAADVILLNAGTLIVCLFILVIPSMLVTRITPVKAIAFK